MSCVCLKDGEIASRLATLPGWRVQDGKLCRVFKFGNFVEAFAFMTACALAAEKLGHHPDWSNVYSTVSVSLSTHDAGGLTELDFKLALMMNAAAD
jgi:4a-hydroxytetrahydrobiopterin dehydratase